MGERGDCEPAEDQQLEGHQHVLNALGGLHAAVRNPTGQGDEHQRGGDVQRKDLAELTQFRIAENLREHQVEEVHRHGRQVRQHDDRGRDQPPATHPTDPRTKGAGRPREGGTGVGHCVVQFAVAQRHQQHRDEAHQEDGGQMHAHLGHGGAQGRSKRVGGCDAGNTDHDGADEAHRSGLQPLFTQGLAILSTGPSLVQLTWVLPLRRCARRFSRVVAGNHDHGYGEGTQYPVCGGAKESGPLLGQAAGTDQQDFAVFPVESVHGFFDGAALRDDDLGFRHFCC